MNQLTRFICILFLFVGGHSLSATSYYFHPQIGKDSNPGTSKIKPFQRLSHIQQLKLRPGDVLYLAAGSEFAGSIQLDGVAGTSEHPIVIKSWDWENRPGNLPAAINAKGYLNGIGLVNCSHFIIENIVIKANGGKAAQKGKMRCGILVKTTRPGRYENITIRKVVVDEVFFENPGYKRDAKEVRTPNGTKAYGWGIRFINSHEESLLKDITVSRCQVSNVAHTGIKFTSRGGQRIQNINVNHNQVERTGGPGIQMSGINDGHIHHNSVQFSGSPDDSRKWGRGSGLWTWGSTDVLIEYNRFTNANGPADSAGCHIDFNCRNVIVQYNFSANNAGGFCEILGNNYNCAYRYNISVTSVAL